MARVGRSFRSVSLTITKVHEDDGKRIEELGTSKSAILCSASPPALRNLSTNPSAKQAMYSGSSISRGVHVLVAVKACGQRQANLDQVKVCFSCPAAFTATFPAIRLKSSRTATVVDTFAPGSGKSHEEKFAEREMANLKPVKVCCPSRNPSTRIRPENLSKTTTQTRHPIRVSIIERIPCPSSSASKEEKSEIGTRPILRFFSQRRHRLEKKSVQNNDNTGNATFGNEKGALGGAMQQNKQKEKQAVFG